MYMYLSNSGCCKEKLGWCGGNKIGKPSVATLEIESVRIEQGDKAYHQRTDLKIRSQQKSPKPLLPSSSTSTMCQFLLLESLCGHRTLVQSSYCYHLYAELQRINNPEERARRNHLPFNVPPQCVPNQRNIRTHYLDEYCGWECRNNGLFAQRRCGHPEARYGPGTERIGVGWQDLGRRENGF